MHVELCDYIPIPMKILRYIRKYRGSYALTLSSFPLIASRKNNQYLRASFHMQKLSSVTSATYDPKK